MEKIPALFFVFRRLIGFRAAGAAVYGTDNFTTSDLLTLTPPPIQF
jgi:hypothetical protein